MRYDEDFYINDSDVTLATGRSVAKFTLVSLGSTTHAFNENQTVIILHWTHDNTNHRYVITPPSANTYGGITSKGIYKAVPGYYMLFLVDDATSTDSWYIHGIPS